MLPTRATAMFCDQGPSKNLQGTQGIPQVKGKESVVIIRFGRFECLEIVERRSSIRTGWTLQGPLGIPCDPQGPPRDSQGPLEDPKVTPQGPPRDPQGPLRDPQGPPKGNPNGNP